MTKKILIVGAGFSGATVANILANKNFKIDVIDKRNHIAGNSYSEKCSKTDIIVHIYGPHIFHTDNEEVWQFVNKFGTWIAYQNRVKATTGSKVYSLPINLHTINQFYEKTFSPKEAKEFIEKISDKTIKEPKSFEEQALKFIGKDLYQAFFKEYTKKQWEIDPKDLPASILKRLPVRFNYNDNYFNHKYQAIPENGYTDIIENMLNHPNINTHLNKEFESSMIDDYDFIFYSGGMDEFFQYSEGKLPYRTLDFEKIIVEGDYQGCAVMNYCDTSEKFTRITEHKHFTPWKAYEKSIIYKEYSRVHKKEDIPYYPVQFADKKHPALSAYEEKAKKLDKIIFIGRLGQYKYMDMDVTILNTFDIIDNFLKKL